MINKTNTHYCSYSTSIILYKYLYLYQYKGNSKHMTNVSLDQQLFSKNKKYEFPNENLT